MQDRLLLSSVIFQDFDFLVAAVHWSGRRDYDAAQHGVAAACAPSLWRRERAGAVSTHSAARQAAANPVKQSQCSINAAGRMPDSVIANGIHAVGGWTLPSTDATMITADIVDANSAGTVSADATSEIGIEIARPPA